MMPKNKKKISWIESIKALSDKFGKATGVIVAVAGIFYTIGYKSAEVFKEREIMRIENVNSAELLKLREEYMDKYILLKEQQLSVNPKDSTDGNKGI